LSSDFLTNGTSDDLAESSLTDKEFLNQFKVNKKMPERVMDIVKTLIDAFVTKGKLKQLLRNNKTRHSGRACCFVIFRIINSELIIANYKLALAVASV